MKGQIANSRLSSGKISNIGKSSSQIVFLEVSQQGREDSPDMQQCWR